MSPGKTPALDRITRDLTDLALKEKLPSILREANETERALLHAQVVLGCRNMNHLLLLGEPGTGKTQLLNELARLTVSGHGLLRGRRLLALELILLPELADKRFLKALIEGQRSGKIILALDDLELFLDLHRVWSGQEILAELRAAITSGAIQCVATTPALPGGRGEGPGFRPVLSGRHGGARIARGNAGDPQGLARPVSNAS